MRRLRFAAWHMIGSCCNSVPVLDQDIDLGHAWYRFLVVTMSLAVLVSRVLLLLLLVRGNYGVQVIAGILCNRKHLLSIKNHVVNATTWKSILAAAKAVVAKNGLPITSMAHAEGLNAGFSGAHPLQALSASAQARKYFEAAADALSEIVRKLLVKGYVLASGDVLKVWKAVKGKVVMAKRNKKLMKAGKYTAMSIARSLAHMVNSVFDRRVSTYDASLHEAMASGQSSQGAHGVDSDGDVLGSFVFRLFHVVGHDAFMQLLKKIAPKVLGVRCLSMRPQTTSTVTWQTLLVHLCEVRQCLKKWGLRQMQALMKRLRAAEDHELQKVRVAHANLFASGYAGGSKRHAVWMVEQAASAVGFQLTPLVRSGLV